MGNVLKASKQRGTHSRHVFSISVRCGSLPISRMRDHKRADDSCCFWSIKCDICFRFIHSLELTVTWKRRSTTLLCQRNPKHIVCGKWLYEIIKQEIIFLRYIANLGDTKQSQSQNEISWTRILLYSAVRDIWRCWRRDRYVKWYHSLIFPVCFKTKNVFQVS